MRIVLVNPPVHHYAAHHFGALPALSLPILSAVLRRAGHDVTVTDLEAPMLAPNQYLNNPHPDIYGFTSLTISAQGVADCIRAAREADFTGRIVVGGAYATLNPQVVIDMGADLVVTGECEGNITQLLESGATGIHAGERADIADIPAPDWEHHDPPLDFYRGNTKYIRERPAITMWARGCPYRCIFCENLIYQGQATRYRPPANIAAEMRYLHEHDHKDILVYDDELFGTAHPEGWMADIADRIHDMKFHLVTQGRCSERFITPELMHSARRAGIRVVYWGVESFLPKVLKAIRKGITPRDIWHTLRVTRDAGIANSLYLQVGSYQETDDDARLTLRGVSQACREGLIDHMQVFVTHVMAGTELARIAAEGWYEPLPDCWHQMKRPSSGTPWMTSKEIMSWRSRIIDACPTERL